MFSTELLMLVRSGSAATTFKMDLVGDTRRWSAGGVTNRTYHPAVWLHTASAKFRGMARQSHFLLTQHQAAQFPTIETSIAPGPSLSGIS